MNGLNKICMLLGISVSLCIAPIVTYASEEGINEQWYKSYTDFVSDSGSTLKMSWDEEFINLTINNDMEVCVPNEYDSAHSSYSLYSYTNGTDDYSVTMHYLPDENQINLVVVDSDREFVIFDYFYSVDEVEQIPDFAGTWVDSVSQRCWLTIENYDGIHYGIDINWSSSASENTHWMFNGTYEKEYGGLKYNGDEIHEIYNEDGSIEKNFIYTDGSGVFKITENGTMIWDDWIENAGKECIFEKEETIYNAEADTVAADVPDVTSNSAMNMPEWYKIYDSFYHVRVGDELSVICQNDTMLYVAFYGINGQTFEWTFDVTPAQVGSQGESIYYYGKDFKLIFYPNDPHIVIETSNDVLAGEYYPNW